MLGGCDVRAMLAVLCVALFPAIAIAQAQDSALPSLSQMLARDRFGPPEAELAAWQSYAAVRTDASDAVSAAAKSEIYLRLGVSFFYAAEYEASLKELDRAEATVKRREAMPLRFWSELYAYRALAMADLKRASSAETAAQEALKFADVARADLSAHTPSWSSALALNAAGYTAYKAGDLTTARDMMCQAATDARAALSASEPLVSLNANNCGIFLYFLDDPRAADVLETAANAALMNVAEGHPVMGQALNTSYAILYRLGRYPEAAALARKHMDLEIKLRGRDSNRVYDPASMLSKALLAQGDLEAARRIQPQVIALADRMRGAGDFRAKGVSRIFYARLLDRLGDVEAARAYYIDGLAEFEKAFSKSDANYAAAQMDFALHLAQHGRMSAAVKEAKAAYSIAVHTLEPTHQDRVASSVKFAVLLARHGDLDQALELARNSHAELQLQRLTLARGRAGRLSTSVHLVRGFSLVAEVALRAGHDALAIEAAQLASLSELSLAAAEVGARTLSAQQGYEALAKALQARRHAQADAQRALDQRLLEARDDVSLAQRATALQEAKANTRLIEAQMETAFPAFRQYSMPKLVPAAALQRSLAGGKAIVLPLESFDQGFTLVITQDGVLWDMSGVRPYEIAQARNAVLESIALARLATQIRLSDFRSDAAYRLFRAVFPKTLYQQLSTFDQLLFMSSGPLSALPPALLLTQPPARGVQMPWLVRAKALSTMSRFDGLEGLDTLPSKTQFIGLGDPTLNGKPQNDEDLAQLFRGGKMSLQSLRDLPPLPGASRELKAMRKAYGRKNTQLLLGRDFTQAKVAQIDFGKAAVVAFATHGLTSTELAGLSEPALVLTPPAKETGAPAQDALLTASEIASMSIPADWVVLSACNTGLGRTRGAPMYSGLAKSFRSAGAKALLLSHWPVRDDAAAQLSVNAITYNRNGMGKAEALRQAQLKMMESTAIRGAAHPAIWAPFVLIAN